MKCIKDRNRIPPIMHELKDPCLAEKAKLPEQYSDNSGLPTSMLFNARHLWPNQQFDYYVPQQPF